MVTVLFRGSFGATIQGLCSLGLGIVLYHCKMCTRHPDLVSLDLHAIPIFNPRRACTARVTVVVLCVCVSVCLLPL